MNVAIRHIALFVPDLRAAEAYYQPLFEMHLIGREAQLGDGLWYTLPFDKGWEEAEAAGIELGMLALRKGAFALALVKGEVPPGQVYAIGLSLPEAEIAGVRARLPPDTEMVEANPGSLAFRDPYCITWQLSVPGNEFRTAGDLGQRWIDP